MHGEHKVAEEANSTPEHEYVSPHKEITMRSNALEMSPPLNRYNPDQFEKTFAHKLDGVTIKELD